MLLLRCLRSVTAIALAFVLAPAAIAESSAPVARPTADVHGTWQATVDYGQGIGHPVFTFVQDGDRVTGDYRGQLGEAKVTGTVNGNEIAFSFTVNPGEQMKIEYTGTVDGSAMRGRVKFGSYGEGTFTAKKQAGEEESPRSHAQR